MQVWKREAVDVVPLQAVRRDMALAIPVATRHDVVQEVVCAMRDASEMHQGLFW